VRGHLGQERYLGLYRPAENGAFAEEVHRSPAIQNPADPSKGNQADRGERRLRVRMVEFQIVTFGVPHSPEEDPGLPLLQGRAWEETFPMSEADIDADVRSRIVRVSPPLDLEEMRLS
jgi:hypothetical protein